MTVTWCLFTVPKCVDVGRVDVSRRVVEHAHFGTVKWCKYCVASRSLAVECSTLSFHAVIAKQLNTSNVVVFALEEQCTAI